MRRHDPWKYALDRQQRQELKDRCYDSTSNTWICDQIGCQKTCNTYHQIRAHLFSVHKSADIVCDFPDCGKKFKMLGTMQKHFRIFHTDDKPFVCPHEECGQRFVNNNDLRAHLVRHETDRRFACDFIGCQKRHQRTHTGERPYVCDWPECGKRFTRPDYLRDHKNVHNNVKPYACHWPGCQYRCSHKSNEKLFVIVSLLRHHSNTSNGGLFSRCVSYWFGDVFPQYSQHSEANEPDVSPTEGIRFS
ncbi:unnamed protein product, partial [Medioppia subpectinata]